MTTFFSHLPFFFNFSLQFSHFTIIRSLDANGVLDALWCISCPLNNNFLFFLSHLPTFFTKTGPLDAPPGWMPGAVAPSAPPLCTPLLAIELSFYDYFSFYTIQ